MDKNAGKQGRIPDAQLDKLWADYLRYRGTGETNEIVLRNQLVERYLGLRNYISDKISIKLPPSILSDDCRQAGYFGLLSAIEAFDKTKNASFNRYASIRIRGSILDFIRSMDPICRETRVVQRKLKEAVRELTVDLGRNPTDEEIISKLDMTYREFCIISHQIANSTSLSLFEIDDNESNNGLIDMIGNNKSQEPSKAIEKKEFFKDLMKGFSEQEILLMTLYYRETLNLKEIGAVLDLSESRVSQLKSDILLKLKRLLKNMKSRLND